jgi:4-diphosphocytidyl-2-C-methyl-D-erythritol kinase
MFVRRSASSFEVAAPAKLNLFLEVLGRRADGYHEIETLMTPISLYDRLQLTPTADSSITLACHTSRGLLGAGIAELPSGPDNLVCKALERLRQRAGIDRGAQVTLEKRIPWEAGLAGGSSNAAAVLLLANEAWRLHWRTERLAQVAAELGSDIPFFLTRGPAVCRGRGERVEPVSGLGRLHVVLVKPPVGLSTAAVYRNCVPADRATGNAAKPRRAVDLVAALCCGDWRAVAAAMFNRLQIAAEPLCDAIARLRSLYHSLGAVAHQMTGSGTSYFGLFRSALQARHAAARARALGWNLTYAVSGVI